MIRLENVSKHYRGGVTALRKADVFIERGEFVFLVGPSGSGKSTFLRLLNKEETPDEGKISVAGKDIGALSSWKVPYLRRNIGCVFQDFKLLPSRSVYENVAFALEVTGTLHRKIRPAVERVLALVGLSAQAQQFPTQLSGGEQQRTAIARALVHDPRIIIADEPTGNLDPVISWEIIQLLLRINELGVTILMASHDAEVVTALRKRVIALEDGRIIRDETGAGYHRED